jgi:hypothetical protein
MLYEKDVLPYWVEEEMNVKKMKSKEFACLLEL